MISDTSQKMGFQSVAALLLFVLLSSGCATTQEIAPSRLERITAELALQLAYPTVVAAEVRQKKLAITLFVDTEAPESSDRFGYLLRSSLSGEMEKRGFQISHQLQGLPAIQILSGGDLHNNQEFRSKLMQYGIDQLLTASITSFEQGILIKVRIIEINTSRVLLSAQSELNKEEYTYFISNRNIKNQHKGKINEPF
jgi:hypothetical protein